MRSLSLFISMACLGVLLLAGAATADDWNRATTAVFQHPVQVSDHVLPAGTYVFKIADIQGDRHVVQVWNADETKLHFSVLGWPEYLREAPDRDLFIFDEPAKGDVAVLKSWFAKGNTGGETFLQPKSDK